MLTFRIVFYVVSYLPLEVVLYDLVQFLQVFVLLPQSHQLAQQFWVMDDLDSFVCGEVFVGWAVLDWCGRGLFRN